jgi:hypothetical protein
MDEQISWCACGGHASRSFRKRTDFYCLHFIPDGWTLEYKTVDTINETRMLHLTGHCSVCGGFMRSGTSIASNFKGDWLFRNIYQALETFRPYDGRRSDGSYSGAVSERSAWYEAQDALPLGKRDKRFRALFRGKDRDAAIEWLNLKYH